MHTVQWQMVVDSLSHESHRDVYPPPHHPAKAKAPPIAETIKPVAVTDAEWVASVRDELGHTTSSDLGGEQW